MRHPLALAWRRILDVALSTDPQRRVLMSMSLLALLIMASSAGVLLLLAEATETMNVTSVRAGGAARWPQGAPKRPRP